MMAREPITPIQRDYLQAVYDLAGCKARNPVAFDEIREQLGYSEATADECCDFWTQDGALDWAALGHIELTRRGVYKAELLSSGEALPLSTGQSDIQSGVGLSSWDVSEGTDSEGLPGTNSVSVVIPARNEALTIDRLVRLVKQSSRVIEVIVIDDGSIDGTADVAASAGAVVVTSSLLGKGASMGDGLRIASGPVVLFLDGDLLRVDEDLVDRMTDPILDNTADMVKAGFTRDAGSVTLATVRPLLGAFFPETAGFSQPLGGIVAARRSLLENVHLEDDYGVDVGLLIDAVFRGARVVEVDIGRIEHDGQPLHSLEETARQVTRVILERAWRHERLNINQVLHMREMERRTQARYLANGATSPAVQPFALLGMDRVLLDGRFVVALAERVGAESDLTRLLDSEMLSDEERTRAIAALFVGVSAEVFDDVARSLPLTEGAVETVIGLRRAGYRVGVVTDGFHIVAETVRRRVFADFAVAHVMHFRNNVSTGEITLSQAMIDPHGCREHPCCKMNVVRYLETTSGLVPERTLAVGAGTNDICLLRAAGIAVAFRTESSEVQQAADHSISGSLTEVLALLGIGQTYEAVEPHTRGGSRTPAPMALGI